MPGNGLGGWSATRTILVSDAPAMGDESCVILGVAGPYSGRGTFVRFRSRADAASDGLRLYVGAATEPLAQLSGSAEYVATSRLSDVAGELLLLRWCYEAGSGGAADGAELDWLSVEDLSSAAVTALDTQSFCVVLDLAASSCAELQPVRYVDGSESPALQLQVFPGDSAATVRNDANGRSEDDRAADRSNRNNFVLFGNGRPQVLSDVALGSTHSLHFPLTEGELNCLTLNFAPVSYQTELRFRWALQPIDAAEQFLRIDTRYGDSDAHRIGPHRDPVNLWAAQYTSLVEEQLRFFPLPERLYFPPRVDRSVRICIRGSDTPPPDEMVNSARDFACVEALPGQCLHRGGWLDDFSFGRYLFTVDFEPPILIGSGIKSLRLSYGGQDLDAQGQPTGPFSGVFALRFISGAVGSDFEERLNSFAAVSSFRAGRRRF